MKKNKNKNLKQESDYFECENNLLNILKFYDGVCLWEQDGCSSAIHSEWAKNFTKLISTFSSEIRASCMNGYLDASFGIKGAIEKDFLLSEKLGLLVNCIASKKVNSQAVDLHLTSRVGLASGIKVNRKRTSDLSVSDEQSHRKRPRFPR